MQLGGSFIESWDDSAKLAHLDGKFSLFRSLNKLSEKIFLVLEGFSGALEDSIEPLMENFVCSHGKKRVQWV